MISDDDQSKHFESMLSEIYLSDVLMEWMKGGDVMKIEIVPPCPRGAIITSRFKPSMNFSNNEFISFYLYGNSSGNIISL